MTVFTADNLAGETPQFRYQAAGDRHDPPPQPSASASTSSGSLSAQDREQTGNVASGKGLGSMKKRLISRLTFSESQSAKDAMLAQPGMRVALDGLCYTVSAAHAYAPTYDQRQPAPGHMHAISAHAVLPCTPRTLGIA